MRKSTNLAGWLYRVGQRKALDLLKRESRRRTREEDYAFLCMSHPGAGKSTQPLELVLDEALLSLCEKDRALILLRFFENRSLRDAGRELNLSEDATQKRIARALNQLREFYRKKGVFVTVAAITSALTEFAIPSAGFPLAGSPPLIFTPCRYA